MKRVVWMLALILLTVPAFFSLLRPGIHNIQDSMQYFRIYELDKCFEDGQIPCRWVPDMGYGFGYPLFIYYSPGPYYLGSLLHSLGFQYIDSVKILFVGGFVMSALGMYALLMVVLSSRLGAFLGSLLYIYAPVRAVQVYLRGSLGEFLAMAIFPWLFFFAYRLIKDIGKNNRLWFGIGVFSLIVTHNLMTVAFMPILLVWIIVLLLQNKNKGNLTKIVQGMLIGFGLAAFYLIPLIFERGYVHLESMTGGYFDFRQHFVSLKQLFISNNWGYGSSQLGPNDDMSLSVGQIQWVMGLLAIILGFANFRKNRKQSIMIMILAGLSLVSLFLIHERSSIIWSKLSFMSLFQFPWRFLVTSTFLLSLLSGYAFVLLNRKSKIVLFTIVILAIVSMYGGFFKPQRWSVIEDSELLVGKEFLKQQTASIFDYLPKSAQLPPNYKASSVPEIMNGEVLVESYGKGSNFQYGVLRVVSDSAKVRLPIFDFPGMVVKVNGRAIAFDHNDCSKQDHCFGQISFKLEKGLHNVYVKLEKTWPRKVGDITSLVTIGFISLFVFRKKIV